MTPQADWVKRFNKFADNLEMYRSDTKQNIEDFIRAEITLAQQRTEKKWRSKVEEQITYLTNKHGLLSSVLSDLLK